MKAHQIGMEGTGMHGESLSSFLAQKEEELRQRNDALNAQHGGAAAVVPQRWASSGPDLEEDSEESFDHGGAAGAANHSAAQPSINLVGVVPSSTASSVRQKRCVRACSGTLRTPAGGKLCPASSLFGGRCAAQRHPSPRLCFSHRLSPSLCLVSNQQQPQDRQVSGRVYHRGRQ